MDLIAKLNTALAGRYIIERELGAGGMATVYLAADVKHDRKVALKVLKPELAAVLGAERFVIEIKTTAALQHPHILPLFDSGTADSFLFYVMPFIEGETLRDKLSRETQLGVDEAVRIAREVLDALQYAHEHGIVHRDVKPENILLHGGHAMVADFGIALAVSAAAGGRMTETGLSLGTPHYMSPEQATAEKEITARSDVYSLGTVLYEMLTGNPPHTGASAQQIIMKIITEQAAPVTQLRKSVPPNVAAAVAKSLEKLPADRFESARAFADALANATYANATASGSARVAAGSRGGVSTRMFAITVGALAAALILTAVLAWRDKNSAPRPMASRFTLGMPDSVSLYTGGGAKFALSRDGSKIVFVGVKDGKRGLYVRRIDDPEAQPVRGAEAGTSNFNVSPSFSPKGDWIVYEVDQVLKKIPTSGGTAQVLADSGNSSSWGDGGKVVYSRGTTLFIGTPEGRDGRVLALPDSAHGVNGYSWPEVLPGGEYALVNIVRANRTGPPLDSLRLGVVTLATGAVKDLGVYGANPRYVSSGHIVFGRAGNLVYVAPFSLRKRELTGAATLLLQNIWQGTGGSMGFSLSDNGILAYQEGTTMLAQNFFAASRSGATRRIPGEGFNYDAPRVSPDGKRIAVNLKSRGKIGVYLVDMGTGAQEVLAAADSGFDPAWSRDGARVSFVRVSRADGKRFDFVSRAADRSGADTVLRVENGTFEVSNLALGASHGFAALMRRMKGSETYGVYLAPMDSLNSTRAFATGSKQNQSPTISADGRLLAWVSDESGTLQVYVQPIPGPAPRIPVSVQGGTEPMWSREGSTLYYRSPGFALSAQLEGTPLRVTRRDTLFSDPYTRVRANGRDWDLFPGGKEFLVMKVLQAERNNVSIVLNWQQMRSADGAAAVPER